MGYLKRKSAAMMYEQFDDLKYKYRNKEFWCRGYYVDTVGKNESRIAEYTWKTRTTLRKEVRSTFLAKTLYIDAAVQRIYRPLGLFSLRAHGFIWWAKIENAT